MPHVRMSSNLNQSIFSFIVGAAFSALLIPIFTTDVVILAILEVPLAFLVSLITITECIYHYKDEVSIETTFNMLSSLLKSLLISVIITLIYTMIIVILEQTIPAFQNALIPLFTQFEALPVFVAIPLIMFIPVFVMIFVLPFLFYVYGKVHVMLYLDKEEKEKRVTKSDLAEKELNKKVFQMLDQLENNAFQLQQYLLELQAVPAQIIEVDDHKKFKTLDMRLKMMKDYVESIAVADDKETKNILSQEEITMKLKEVEMQKKTVIDLVQQNIKKLYNDKKEFELDETEEAEISEEKVVKEAEEEIKLPDEAPEEEVIEEPEEEVTEEPEEEVTEEPEEEVTEEPEEEVTEEPEEEVTEEPEEEVTEEPEEEVTEEPEEEVIEEPEEELQDPSEIVQEDSEVKEKK